MKFVSKRTLTRRLAALYTKMGQAYATARAGRLHVRGVPTELLRQLLSAPHAY